MKKFAAFLMIVTATMFTLGCGEKTKAPAENGDTPTPTTDDGTGEAAPESTNGE